MADKTPGVDQYAIRSFAEALEVVPKTLANNAGLNATEVVTRLYALHSNGHENAGVNVKSCFTASKKSSGSQSPNANKASPNDKGVLVDTAQEGIVDHLLTRRWALKLAVDAALTVLRVDHIIVARQAGGPKAPKGGANVDDD